MHPRSKWTKQRLTHGSSFCMRLEDHDARQFPLHLQTENTAQVILDWAADTCAQIRVFKDDSKKDLGVLTGRHDSTWRVLLSETFSLLTFIFISTVFTRKMRNKNKLDGKAHCSQITLSFWNGPHVTHSHNNVITSNTHNVDSRTTWSQKTTTQTSGVLQVIHYCLHRAD